MNAVDFSLAYSRTRREVELNTLQTLIDGMASVGHPIWMISVATKQDLWFDAREDAREHYTNGAYSKIIGKLASALGERNFQHEFVPVSLTLSSLGSLDGQIFAPTCAGYDLSTHQRYLL